MIKLQISENSLRPGEYMFTPSTEESLSIEEICLRSVENGGKIDYNTMVSAVAQFERQARRDILDGKMINTSLYHLQVSAHGSTRSGKPIWGDDKSHYLEPRFTARPDFKEELNRQPVEVIDIKQIGPQIFDLYDYYTKTHIGQVDPQGVIQTTITPHRNLRIEGMAMRIMGEEAQTDWGIFFIPVDEAQPTVRVDDIDLIKNDPKELIIVIPGLPQGEYHVEIRTYSNSQGRKAVKELRTVRFKHGISVE